MAGVRLTQEDVAQTIQRAREIVESSSEGGDLLALRDCLDMAEELGVPRDAMIQALAERGHFAGQKLAVGESVFARSTDGHYYPGRIEAIQDHTVDVKFLKGGTRSCAAAEVRPLDIVPGRRLQGEAKDWGWANGEVKSYDEASAKVTVLYGFGTEEKLPLSKLRLLAKHVEPGSEVARLSEEWSVRARRWAITACVVGLAAGMLLGRVLPELLGRFIR